MNTRARGNVESDAARYVEAESTEVLEAIVLINDWAHISRKWREGTLGKKLRDREGKESLIRGMLNDLRAAPTENAFEGLKTKVLEVHQSAST